MKMWLHEFFYKHPVILWICMGMIAFVVFSIPIVEKFMGMFYFLLFAGIFIYAIVSSFLGK